MSSSARNLLLHQSVEHLLSARYSLEASFADESSEPIDRESARDLGLVLFSSIAEVLKLAVDFSDPDTFSRLERKWARIFDDVWLPGFPSEAVTFGHSRRGPDVPSTELLKLLRHREILRFGLSMWITHLLDRPQSPERTAELSSALSQLAGRFPSIEWMLDAHDAAQEVESGAEPWINWLLGELAENEVHTIPSAEKLLRTAIILTIRSVSPRRPEALRPREWFVWRRDELSHELERLESSPAPWQVVLGLTGPFDASIGDSETDPAASWSARIGRVRDLFIAGEEAQRQHERQSIQTAPVDVDRVRGLRDRTLAIAAQSRVLRDTVQHQATIARLTARPGDLEPLVTRTWTPRSFFVQGSRVVGVDFMANDLARPLRDAERQQLMAALPASEPESRRDEPVADALHRVIEQMRDDGLHPTLMVLPLNWRLQREIGFSGFGPGEVRHPLVPIAHPRDFCGVFDDVLALDLVGMPEDRVWVLDLGVAIRYEEWPSEEQSGVEFVLQSFDDDAAASSFLEVHPEVAAADATREASIETLRERVLITLRLCWRISSVDGRGARAVAIPAELQGDE